MKTHFFRFYFLPIFILSSALAHAIPLASVKVISVEGSATYSLNNSDEEKLLKRNMILREGERITTSALSKVHLLFSNGSELTVKENSNLLISTLSQESFEGADSEKYPKADPSQSVTILELTYGKVAGHVKQLRADSVFKVETIFGVASIYGTQFIVELFYDPLRNEFILNVQNIDGLVDFISQFAGATDYGRQNILIKAFDPDAREARSMGLPPKHTITIRQSSEDPRFDYLISLFPEGFESGILSESGLIVNAEEFLNKLQPFPTDQDIVIISPNQPEEEGEFEQDF